MNVPVTREEESEPMMSSADAGTPSFVVVADSTSDIEPDLAADNGITVVPLSVMIGDESFTDGVLSQQQFFDRMNAAERLPTTSQPAVGAFAEAYARALETADQVISVHISSKLSGTLESAYAAAEQFVGRVHVFDSLNLSWGCAWQVVEAARCAAEGIGPEAALERIASVRDRVRLIVGVDSLDNLTKGGRIGRVGSFLGSLLNLKVTFTVGPDGAFVPVARSRGEKAALQHTLDWVAEQMGSATSGRFAVGHALSRDRALWLSEEIAKRFEVVEMVIYEAGSVIATHTGTGWAVAVLPDA
jgi:DegV family protein with EDD domain